MAIQMTAKERLLAKAAANRAEQDRLRASMPAADPDYMDRLKEEEKQRQANASAQRVRDQRSGTVQTSSAPKTPISDRAKKVAEIRKDIDTTPVQSKVGKAAQSIGLNTVASLQYLGETAVQFKENTDTFLDTEEADDYAAAVAEFNRIRKYAPEDSPEYLAAKQAMDQARVKMEQASAEAQSKTVDADSLGTRMMAEANRLKEEALEGTEGAGRFLAETGMSIASNLAKLPAGAAAPLLMGAEAAAGKAYELQQQGVGAGQALGRGVTSGVIEGITEKMGLDSLFDVVKTGGRTALKNVLKQAGVEGTEEGFSYVFNYVADKMAKDPNAQFNWQDLLKQIGSGAISGLAFGAGATAVNRAQADPGVIGQTGKEKQAPGEGSLHLASDGKATLPNAEINTEVVKDNAKNALPLPEQKSSAQLREEIAILEERVAEAEIRAWEAQGDERAAEEVLAERARERLEAARNAYPDALSREGETQSLPMPMPKQQAVEPVTLLPAENKNTAGQSQTAENSLNILSVNNILETNDVAAGSTIKNRGLLNKAKNYFKEKFQTRKQPKKIQIRTLYENGAPYVANLTSDSIDKLFSSDGVTSEKIAALDGIETLLPKAEYQFSQRDDKNRDQIERYDYFSLPVKIDGVSEPRYLNVRIRVYGEIAARGGLPNKIWECTVDKMEISPHRGRDGTDVPVFSLIDGADYRYSIPEEETTVKTNPVDLPMEEAVKSEEGLPLPRQESLREAFTASVNGGRTLGDNERRTGLPLPTEVQGQLEALEALTTPMDNDDYDVSVIRKYMGEEAVNYWLEHKDEEAGDYDAGRPTPEHSGAVADEQGNVVGTEATEKLGVRIEGSIADWSKVQTARQAQGGLDAANRQIEQAEKDLHASAAEKRMAENVAKGIDSLDSYKYGWDGKDNRRRSVVEKLSALYRLRDTYDRNAVKALGRKNKDRLIDTLNKEILNHVEQATPPGAASLHTNTWERNNLRTWGRELGETVNRLVFDPIRRNEANRIRWMDRQADDMKILGELTDAENEAVFDMLDSGKETAAYDGVRNEVVQEAADKLKTKYAQYYDAINDVLVAHGYPEIGFIKNYTPHKQPEQMKAAMDIFEKLGISDKVTELPTELAGRTDMFKPGKKWNPHFLHRTGEQAAPDAVGGYMSYLNYMSEVLYHVDDIQRVRTFGDQIRYLYGDEGIQGDYDAVRADTTMNEQEKELELQRIRERQTDNSKMGAYVTALDNYANILAGKQTQVDRAAESAIGRRGLNWLQKPVQVLVQSSIPGNISSAINQTVQLPWLTAEAGEGNVLQAATELLRGKLKREGFAAQSDFVTGKRGAENYNALKTKTAGEKVLDAASIPFETVDDATSQVIVRAFYLKNVKAGMDHETAIRTADRQAERLVGSRMKGQKANVFSDKSLKLLTTFQLEVANQWQHLKFDLPQEYRDIERTKGTAAARTEAAKRMVKGAVYTFALNSIIEQISGNKPAGYDIIGAIWDYIKAGLPGEDEEEEGFDWGAGAADLRDNLVDDLPFVGNIGAIAGIGDGRLPLPQVKLGELWKAGVERAKAKTDEEKTAANKKLGASVLHNAAAVMPMGGQIKKTIQGTADVVRGGRYTDDGKQLMFEVEQSVPNAIRGAVFGRNALPETREYWDEGGKAVLSEKQTALMEKAKEYGVDQSVYVDFVQQAKGLTSDKDAEGETVKGSLERKKIALLEGMDLTGEQKLQLYLDNVASESRTEDVEAMRAAGMTWEQMAPAIDTYLSAEAADLSAAGKATELAAWADQNLKPEQAAVVKERLEYWQQMRAEASSYEKLAASGLESESAQQVFSLWQGLEPEEGKTSVSVNQKRRAVAESRDLSEEDKRTAIRSTLDSDSARASFDSCVAAGVRMSDYVKAKEFYSEAEADKDENGKSITDSKKEKVWNFINGLAATAAQKDALSVACGYDSKLEEAPWHNGVESVSLPGLPLPEVSEKSEQFTMPTLPASKEAFAMPALPLP